MSKHEGHWEAAGEAVARELPGPLAGLVGIRRDEALIRFLATGQAMGQPLSGAFADDEADRLKREKEK